MGGAALAAAVALITQAGTYRLETKTNQPTNNNNNYKQANKQQQQTILIWTWFTSPEINEFHIFFIFFFNVNYLLSTIPLQKLNGRKVGRETLGILNRDTHSFLQLVRVNNDSVYTQSQRPRRCWVEQRTEQESGAVPPGQSDSHVTLLYTNKSSSP